MFDFKAAIFDLDGTLIDSMGVWEDIDIDFLAKRHLSVPEGYISEISAKSFKEAAEYTISLFGLKERAEDIIEEWNQMAIDEYSHHVPLKPYAKEYLLFLKGQGIKLGVATALPKVLYEPVLKNNGIYALFDAFASTDEVVHWKGSPDIYLLAAKNWVFPLATALPLKMYWPVFRGLYWRECKRMAYMTNIQVMSKCRFKNCQNGIFIALRKCFHNSASRAVEKSAGLLHQPMCIGIEETAPVHN